MAAEQPDEILLTIKVSEDELERQSAAALTQIAKLKQGQQELNAEFKAGKINAKQYGESQAALNKDLSAANVQLKGAQDTLKQYARTQREAEGSIQQMRAALILQNKAYDGLSKAERNAAEGQALQKHIRSLNDELKDLEAETGRAQRNVGNYIRDVNVMGVNVGQAADSFKDGVQGVQVFTKALFTTKGALTALTAIPIVLFLVALVAFFKATDEGADKLEQTIAALRAGFDAVLKTIAPLGALLVDTFTHPIDAVQKLGNALLHPLDSLKAIATGSRKMADDIATNFASAANAAVVYTKQMQDIEDAENGLIAQRERVGLQVDQAILKVKDRNLTEKQRIAILQAAGKAESDLAKQQLIIARDRLAAELRQNIVTQKSRKLTDDELKRQLEAEATLIKAKRDSLNTQQTITNRISALREQDAADAKTASDKAKELSKQAAEERVYEVQLAIVQAKKKNLDTLQLEEELIRRQGAVQLLGLRKNGVQRKLIEAQIQADILKLVVEHAAKLAEAETEGRENGLRARLVLARKGSQQEFDLQAQLLSDKLDKDKAAAVDAAEKDATLKKTLQKRLRLLDATFNADSEKLAKDYATNLVSQDNEIGQLRIQTQQDIGQQSIKNDRNVARQRIELEEKTQLRLLAIEKKAALAQVDPTDKAAQDKVEQEFLVRQNAIQAKALAANRELNKQKRADDAANEDAIIEDRLHKVREGSKAELVEHRKKLAEKRKAELDNEKLTDDQKKEINSKYDAEDDKLKGDYVDKQFGRIVESAQAGTAALNAIIDASTTRQTNLLDQQQQAILSSAALTADQRSKIEADFAKKREKLEKESAEKRRKIASLENIINTAVAVGSALKVLPPFGAILAALIVAKGIAQQVVIDNQKFATGGVYRSDGRGAYVTGPGTGKSDSINARISNGESILTAKATQMFYPQLSAMNVAGGGRAFPGLEGAFKRYDATHATPQYNLGGVSVNTDADAIGRSVADSLRRDGKFIVSVVDVIDKTKQYTQAQARGDS